MAIRFEQLWTRWRKQHDLQARDQLVEQYLWLVRYVVARVAVGLPSHFDRADLEGSGSLGLLVAVSKYDPEKGVRFETYAIPWVRGAVLEALRSAQWAPRLRKRARQLARAGTALEGSLGRAPSPAELAAHLGLDAAEVLRRLRESEALTLISIDQTFADEEGEGGRLADQLTDPHSPDPAELAHLAERQRLLGDAIGGLTAQERLVISLLYYEELTARETGRLLRLSGARVSQIHSRAVARLRGKLARVKAQLVS